MLPKSAEIDVIFTYLPNGASILNIIKCPSKFYGRSKGPLKVLWQKLMQRGEKTSQTLLLQKGKKPKCNSKSKDFEVFSVLDSAYSKDKNLAQIENQTHNLSSFHLQLPLPTEDLVAHSSLDAVARHDHLGKNQENQQFHGLGLAGLLNIKTVTN